MAHIVEIEGTQWQQIERRSPKSSYGMKAHLMALGLASMAHMGFGGGYSRPTPKVDLVEEFKLIQ